MATKYTSMKSGGRRTVNLLPERRDWIASMEVRNSFSPLQIIIVTMHTMIFVHMSPRSRLSASLDFFTGCGGASPVDFFFFFFFFFFLVLPSTSCCSVSSSSLPSLGILRIPLSFPSTFSGLGN